MNHRSQRRLTRLSSLRTQAGVTLVESLLVLTIAAVSLGAAVPGFETARERRHLEGAAAQLETDMQFARSLAMLHNRNLRISFVRGGSDSCYVVHTGSSSDCSCAPDGSSSCSADAQALKTVGFSSASPVQIGSTAASVLFDASKGTVTPTTTVRFTTRSGTEVRQIVNLVGRVRWCTPSKVPGYRSC